MTERRRQQNLESQRRFQDNAASIDQELDQARAGVDWARRRAAEKSLVEWVKAYCVPLMLPDEPSEKGYQVLAQMEKALTAHSNYMICMPRSHGKTSFVECATLYALATGIQKYVVCISNNARAAQGVMQDIWRAVAEPDTPFAIDYPDVCVPFQLCSGSFRRRQTYRGVSTDIQKNAHGVVFPRLCGEGGGEVPTSGSVLTCRGITSGLRGMKFGKLRPSLVLLDDLQSSESAENPEQVEKLLNLVRKDVMSLGGKERLSVLCAATPICPDDMVERLMQDKSWKTQVYRGIETFPEDMERNGEKGLWGRYFRMYDAECVDDRPHDGSLEFYRANREAMDKGASVFNERRYSEADGHISALQKLLELRHQIGDAAFQAEYQMKPKRYSFQLDVTPRTICSRAVGAKRLDVPDGYVLVAAATDLNVSYAVTTAVTAFRPDMTAHVLFHETQPCRIDGRANDAEYGRAVVAALKKTAERLKGLGLKLDGWAIDASGRNWDAVCSFARSPSALGLPACAFAGRAAHVFNPFVRSRLRDAIGRTVLCGDPAERLKAGSGQKYVFFDADYYKEAFQKAVTSEAGAPGACSLYDGDADEHADFAVQCCNERLVFVKHMQDGRSRYEWKTSEPHDYLDCMSMCYAVAAQRGISGASAARRAARVPSRPVRRPRVRVV